jgi:hypothetical protein
MYRDTTYKRFSFGGARVDHVEGELYWRVEVGERVDSEDYIAPPRMLSYERSESEITWSLATYVTRDEIAKKFPNATLPPQVGVAPNQPAPGPMLGRILLVCVALVFLLGVVQAIRAHASVVTTQTVKLDPQKNADEGQVVFTDPFPLRSGQPIAIDVAIPALENTWAEVHGDIIDESTGLLQGFDVPVEYYAGIDEGESWDEGSRRNRVVLGALPTGTYALRLEVFREKWGNPGQGTATVTVTEGVARPGWTALALVVLLVGFGGAFLIRRSFEKRRWENSDVAGDDE